MDKGSEVARMQRSEIRGLGKRRLIVIACGYKDNDSLGE